MYAHISYLLYQLKKRAAIFRVNNIYMLRGGAAAAKYIIYLASIIYICSWLRAALFARLILRARTARRMLVAAARRVTARRITINNNSISPYHNGVYHIYGGVMTLRAQRSGAATRDKRGVIIIHHPSSAGAFRLIIAQLPRLAAQCGHQIGGGSGGGGIASISSIWCAGVTAWRRARAAAGAGISRGGGARDVAWRRGAARRGSFGALHHGGRRRTSPWHVIIWHIFAAARAARGVRHFRGDIRRGWLALARSVRVGARRAG